MYGNAALERPVVMAVVAVTLAAMAFAVAPDKTVVVVRVAATLVAMVLAARNSNLVAGTLVVISVAKNVSVLAYV